MASPLFRLRHHCSAVRHIAAMLPLCPILSPFVLIYFRVTSAPACHLSPLAPSLRFHRFASPRFASPRLTSLHLVIIAHVFSLILLVATLLVHPPLSLLPATSPPTPSLISPRHPSRHPSRQLHRLSHLSHLAPGISWTCSCALHGPLMPPPRRHPHHPTTPKPTKSIPPI